MEPQPTTRREILRAGGATALAGLAGCSSPLSTSPPAENEAAAGRADSDAEPGDYTEIYEQTVDSVVLVETDGQGTGFMYDASHVVTNAHVVGVADRAGVRFNNGGWARADVVGVDQHSDLAVLSVNDAPDTATPLPFTDDQPEIGQRVLAIGNPYNLDGTMTSGIVSGVNRSIPSPAGFEIPDAIQTDAPVNPGNSGGPLVDRNGNVVAVINSGGGDNIGFGISAALTERVVSELIATGSYEHSYLGVSFDLVSPAVAAANDLETSRGLLVVRTVDGGPADSALRSSSDVEIVDGQRIAVGGDVIRAIDGQSLATGEDLGSYLALNTRPGDTVKLRILRDGNEQTVGVELGARPTSR